MKATVTQPGVEDALRLAAAGDREAIEAVVRSFWDPVMRFFWKRVGPVEAEDLSQQVFASALRAVRLGAGPRGGARQDWRRFLLASARNRLISHWRHQNARPPAWSMEWLPGEEVQGQPPAAWGPVPPAGHPADFNCDGLIGIGDFLALLGNWGPCP